MRGAPSLGTWRRSEAPGGHVLAGARLPHSLHGQPEGLTLLGDSLLLVADEGTRGTSTLTTYRRVR